MSLVSKEKYVTLISISYLYVRNCRLFAIKLYICVFETIKIVFMRVYTLFYCIL